MQKNNIVIAGGGFAGCEALRVLGRKYKLWSSEYELTMIDKKRCSEFLPMLPDILSERIVPEALQRDLKVLCEKNHARFVNDRIDSIDPSDKKVSLAGGKVIEYSKLIVATGAEVNYFGNDLLRRNCFQLYSCADAVKLKEAVLSSIKKKGAIKLLIVGGGYTGVEIASNISLLARRKGVPADITLLEASDEILAKTPKWVRSYSLRELERYGIKVKWGKVLDSYDGSTARLASGEEIKEVLCVWSAGVKATSCLKELPSGESGRRIWVDAMLRPKDDFQNSLLLCGDPAEFSVDGKPLRMAVMFSMGEGKVAAMNLIRSIRGRAPKRYKAVDLGFLVPFATGSAYGPVLGIRARGRAGYLMHYAMCLYRSAFLNKLAILKWWMSKKRTKKKGGDKNEQ